MKIDTDRILGLSAMLVSLITLIIFIYQTNLMRTQSRLSVRPRLSFTQDEVQRDSVIQLSTVLENKGLGPAIVDSIRIIYQNQRYHFDFREFLKETFPKIEQYGTLTKSRTLGRGSTLSPNEVITLYTFQAKQSRIEELVEYLELVEEEPPFAIEVTYSSIYEETWLLNNRSDHDHPIVVD